MAADDGDMDDPGLRPLRAVWLSMPDEDPPERGLAELMAAARVKAEEMAKPSLWERISMALRRPPVLALATVVVLIGGAVFITQRKDKLASEHEVAAPSATQEVALEREKDTAATGAAAGSAAPASATAAPMQPPTDSPAVEPAPEPTKAVDRKRAYTGADKGQDLAPPRIAKQPARRAQGTSMPKAEATGGASSKSDSSRVFADDLRAPENETSSGEGQLQERAPTIVQMHKQALAAVARGDCESARTTMKRIASQDAAYYKDKIATDPQLRTCLVGN